MPTQTNNPPVETHRDGAVSAKVWRNLNKDSEPYYAVTFQRTYTDPATNQIAESRSFGGTDILKIPGLADDAYRTIGQMRKMDKAERNQVQEQQQHQNQPPLPTVNEHQGNNQQGLEAQRDIAMADAQPDKPEGPAQAPTYER